MTVSSAIAQASFVYTGSQISFPCGFPAESAADISVELRTSGAVLPLVQGAHYTVSLAPGSNLVTVARVFFPAGAGTLVVKRSTSFLQPVAFAEGEAFSAETHQRLHNGHVLRAQELRRDVNVAIALTGGSNPRGEWTAPAVYAPGDWVSRNGSSYRALVASSGVPPEDAPATWFLIAGKGATGETGATGAPGVPGNGGLAVIDFGVWPGDDIASLSVADAAIGSSALIVAYLAAADSADHSADEHLIEEMDILCGPAVAGVGFTLFARTRTRKLYGRWNVNWLRR